MTPTTEDSNKLKELEESLWKSETRFDLEYMEKVLSPEFFEFGRSGKVYARKDTLYGARPQVINAKFPLKNFKVEMIAENVALVTYISEVTYEKVEVGNRSSIWIKTPKGWQLRFHQGTPVEDK
jgi:hypothetical protein